MIWRGVLMVVVLVAVIADRSDASLLAKIQKLAMTGKNGKPIQVFFGSNLLSYLNKLFGLEF